MCAFGIITVTGDADLVMLDTVSVSSGNSLNPTPQNSPCGDDGHAGHLTLLK
jgi:hypothetical protein